MDKILYMPSEGKSGFWLLKNYPTKPDRDDFSTYQSAQPETEESQAIPGFDDIRYSIADLNTFAYKLLLKFTPDTVHIDDVQEFINNFIQRKNP